MRICCANVNAPEDAVLPENTWFCMSQSSPVPCFQLQLHSNNTETSSARQPTGSFLPNSQHWTQTSATPLLLQVL